MTAVTENDLKEIKDLIISGQKAIEGRLTSIEIGQAEIKGEIKTLDAKINGVSDRIKPIEAAIPGLAEKVGELKNWKQIGLTLSGAIIGGLITYFVKTPNP